ncbi:Amino acid transporter [Zostera marina]|uniref:Amino acid transporter n=1 Tax=Zostera marina TaxID=29655 RepID=A0A0K9NJ44_ZOSMR|nr:Amino acid transporter [Zostera marina]
MDAPLLHSNGQSEGNVSAEDLEKDIGCQGDDILPSFTNETSTLMTCLNGLNALFGIGLLSMPYALSEAGWLSLVPFLAIAVLCYYTGLLLKRCMDKDPNINTYPDVGEYAFGRKGKVTISVIMHLELYLVSVGFLILEAANLDKLFPNAKFEWKSPVGVVFELKGKSLFTILSAFCFLPSVWLKNMGSLGYVSAGGVFASFVMVCSVIWIGLSESVGIELVDMKVLDMAGLSSAMGLYFFCFCGHAVFPSLYTSMKYKHRFNFVLSICFFICSFNYIVMAIVGYLLYGDQVKSQITLNLPVEYFSTKVVIYTVLLNPLTRFALILSPVATFIEDKLLPSPSSSSWHPRRHRFSSFVVRSLLVMSTAVVALSIPFFAHVVSLIGSFMSITASVLFPCLCYMKIFRVNPRENCTFESLCLTAIVIGGIIATCLGTYTSFRDIFGKL